MANLEGKLNPWKEAIVDACVVNHISWDENDPRKTISDLIAYENAIALDPQVSEDAAKLIAIGRSEWLALNHIERWRQTANGAVPASDGEWVMWDDVAATERP